MIIFDFDGTIANSTPYHKIGWVKTLAELGITLPIDQLLPYEPALRERFDSYPRVQTGFIKNPQVSPLIEAYFLMHPNAS